MNSRRRIAAALCSYSLLMLAAQLAWAAESRPAAQRASRPAVQPAAQPTARPATHSSASHRPASQARPAQWEELAPGEMILEEPADMGFHEPGCTSCAGGCEGGCGWNCNRPCGYWGQVELLLWWRRGRNFPPLVTSSPNGTAGTDAGVLGEPGTVILFGSETTGDQARTGGRITLGRWLDSCQIWGVEGRYFAVDDAPVSFSADSTGDPILARPFFNVATGLQDARLVAFPSVVTGDVHLESRSDMQAADVTFRRLLGRTSCWRFDGLVGYFFSRIDEDLRIVSNTTSIDQGGTIPVGTTSQLTDVFDTQNEFHGAQVGVLSEFRQGCWRVDLLGKLSLGNMHQIVSIAGQSVTTVPGETPVVDNQGLLALDSNSGLFARDVFAVVPELGINVAYSIHPCIDLTLGYSLVYWSRVAQPGDQVNLLINPTQTAGDLVGAAQPDFLFQDNTYWVQGLSFGVECRF